jgi:hypothetical protein
MYDFGGKGIRKRTLGRPRPKWKDIKLDIREIG